jgi:hypothetical protein
VDEHEDRVVHLALRAVQVQPVPHRVGVLALDIADALDDFDLEPPAGFPSPAPTRPATSS